MNLLGSRNRGDLLCKLWWGGEERRCGMGTRGIRMVDLREGQRRRAIKKKL